MAGAKGRQTLAHKHTQKEKREKVSNVWKERNVFPPASPEKLVQSHSRPASDKVREAEKRSRSRGLGSEAVRTCRRWRHKCATGVALLPSAVQGRSCRGSGLGGALREMWMCVCVLCVCVCLVCVCVCVCVCVRLLFVRASINLLSLSNCFNSRPHSHMRENTKHYKVLHQTI